eukprot:scaffold1307_cov200-Pinguiococcus_pyrenoidosus.AAC.158
MRNTLHTQFAIYDLIHCTRPDHRIGGMHGFADVLVQRLIRSLRQGRHLQRAVQLAGERPAPETARRLPDRPLPCNLLREPHALSQGLDVGRILQEIRLDGRRVQRIAAFQRDAAHRSGPDCDALEGDAGSHVATLPKVLVGLNSVGRVPATGHEAQLEVGVPSGLAGLARAVEESSLLASRRRQRALAPQSEVQQGGAPQLSRLGPEDVIGDGVLAVDVVGYEASRLVPKPAADAGSVLHETDAVLGKMLAGPDATQHEKLRGRDRSCAQEHLRLRVIGQVGVCDLAGVHPGEFHADGLGVLEEHSRGAALRDHLEVLPAQDGLEVRRVRRDAASILGGHAEASVALLRLLPVVEVVVGVVAQLLAGVQEGLADGALVAGVLHRDGPLLAVEVTGRPVEVLVLLVVLQEALPAPLAAAGLFPGLEVLRSAPVVQHGVGVAGAAEGLAPAQEDAAIASSSLALRAEGPVEARVEQLGERGRRCHLHSRGHGARLQHEDPLALISRQAVGQHAAGGAAADDDVVVAHCSGGAALADGHAMAHAGQPSGRGDRYQAEGHRLHCCNRNAGRKAESGELASKAFPSGGAFEKLLGSSTWRAMIL